MGSAKVKVASRQQIPYSSTIAAGIMTCTTPVAHGMAITTPAVTTGYIAGTALTVASGTGLVIGQSVLGPGVLQGTQIVSGSGTAWVVNRSQTIGSSGTQIAITTTFNVVALFFQDSPQALTFLPATVTSTTVFTVALPTGWQGQGVQGQVSIDFYSPGTTGAQLPFTIVQGQSGSGNVISSFLSGAGAASYNIDVSLDDIHWVLNAATLTHAGNDTQFVTVAPNWCYARPNITSILASQTLTILVAG
jgi:hypothetical protein